jgi:hypothetical protein
MLAPKDLQTTASESIKAVLTVCVMMVDPRLLELAAHVYTCQAGTAGGHKADLSCEKDCRTPLLLGHSAADRVT